jgi:hypothetical protein
MWYQNDKDAQMCHQNDKDAEMSHLNDKDAQMKYRVTLNCKLRLIHTHLRVWVMFIVEDLLLEIAAKMLFLYSNLCIVVKFDCLSCSYTSRLYPILLQAI